MERRARDDLVRVNPLRDALRLCDQTAATLRLLIDARPVDGQNLSMTSDDGTARDPIALLMLEHDLIEQVLSALERYADRVAAGAFERDDLALFVAFIQEFADARHHRKEEDILFTSMGDNGFPSEGGPIAVMLHEHEVGRSLATELARIAGSDGAWSGEVATRLVAVAREFAGLLRSHIAKENDVLYPMARSILPAPAMHEVALRCEAIEQDYARRGEGARLDELGADLARRYAA